MKTLCSGCVGDKQCRECIAVDRVYRRRIARSTVCAAVKELPYRLLWQILVVAAAVYNVIQYAWWRFCDGCKRKDVTVTHVRTNEQLGTTTPESDK